MGDATGRSRPGVRWLLAAAVTGAALGIAIALPVFGYPPAELLADEDVDRTDCGLRPPGVSRRTVELLEERGVDQVFTQAWREAGGSGTPTFDLQPARCGEAIRVWGTPLRPAERARWLDTAEGVLTSPLLTAPVVPEETDPTDTDALLAELEADAARLSAALEEQTLELARVGEAVDLEAVLGEGPGSSPLLESFRDELLTAYGELLSLEVELAEVESAIAELRTPDTAEDEPDEEDPEVDTLAAFQDGSVFLAPPSPAFPLSVGAILGALLGLLVVVLVTMLRTRPRRSPTTGAGDP